MNQPSVPVPSPNDPRAVRVRPALVLRAAVLVGLGVSVLSLPVVTALPATAAGVAHLRTTLDGQRPGVRDLLRDALAALRDTWAYALGVTALAVILWFDLGATRSGAVAGGPGVAVGAVVLGALLAVVLLRACGGWRRGLPWAEVVRAAGRRTGDDLLGSALLLLAVAAGVLLALRVPPLVLLLPGLLALAVVAVDRPAGRPAHPGAPEGR